VGKRFPFNGLPQGWYAVATSDELKPGGMLSRRYFDKEIVIYRTQQGKVRVMDAFCPHLGAHLGKVGCVEGETVRCGFHAFRYDLEGRCVDTGYDGPPPPKAQLNFWNARELNGLVIVWYDQRGEAPTWEVPALDESGWTPMRWKRYQIATHPQETTENSVDFGHFTKLHGFTDGSITVPIAVDGPLLSSSYQALRPLPHPKLTMHLMPVDYDVKVWGLGYSQVDVHIKSLRLEFRVWVLPVPHDEENIDLIIGLAACRNIGPLAPLARLIAHRIVCKEVDQDLDVWTYKAYLDKPALAKGDGPVAEYRRYATRFYPPEDSHSE
jgi:nitrite reductase/ring-hydroxylating ferredoxin subunit